MTNPNPPLAHFEPLLQDLGAFLLHVADAPESAPETREQARVLLDAVVEARNLDAVRGEFDAGN